MLRMELEYNRGILFVRLKGILNNKTSYKINNYLNPVIKKHKIKYLIYNCAYLDNVDSSGIDAILNSKYLIKENKGQIRITELQERLKPIVKFLKIKKIKNEAEAFNLMEAIR